MVVPTSTINQSYSQQVPVQNTNVLIKEPTMAVQTRNLPSQGVNLTQQGDYGKSGDTKNLQYIQNKYGQNEYQRDNTSYQQSQYQYQGSNVQNQGQIVGGSNMNTEMRRRERSSSSSSNEKERNKRMNYQLGTNTRSNVNTLGQPIMIEPGYAPTTNIETGYGQSGRHSHMYESNQGGHYETVVYTGAPLGKNLYGETGYASLQYTIQ